MRSTCSRFESHRFGWSELDGLRTAAPHVLVSHCALDVGPVSELFRQEQRDESFALAQAARWQQYEAVQPADLREAARVLLEAGVATFTAKQLAGVLPEAPARARHSLVELLKRQASTHDGVVLRVRPGRYRLRVAGNDAVSPCSAVAGHVLSALHRLAERGTNAARRQDVERELVAMGVPYSGRTVRDGLLQLQRSVPPAVTALAGRRYELREPSAPEARLAKGDTGQAT